MGNNTITIFLLLKIFLIFALQTIKYAFILMSSPAGKILLVDSDKNISDLLNFNLSSEGFSVRVVEKAEDVKLDAIADLRLAIIDAMEQPYNGIDLTLDIKASPLTSSVPVIICTERENEDMIVRAFESGAEDFVTKPFSLRELVARIKAILRRHPIKAPVPQHRHALEISGLNLHIDVSSQRVMLDDMVIPLTKTEYAILIFLIEHCNSFFTRADICQEVWKDEVGSNERIVDTNISRLRKKLGDSGKYIINRYGMGYAFVDKLAQ